MCLIASSRAQPLDGANLACGWVCELLVRELAQFALQALAVDA